MKSDNEKYCQECGAVISKNAEICPKCGVRQASAPAMPVQGQGSSGCQKGCLIVAALFGGLFVLGIVSSIAIPKFAATKEKAYLAMVKTDLRNLATAEEGYAANNAGKYFSHDYETSMDTTNGFAPSAGVTIRAVKSKEGYSAIGSHASSPGHLCAIYVGIAPQPPAVYEGAPACN